VAVAHTDRSPEDVQAALDELVDDGLVEDQGERYRLTDDVERVPHPGEITPRD
jgi:predicted transcriptional regulator